MVMNLDNIVSAVSTSLYVYSPTLLASHVHIQY